MISFLKNLIQKPEKLFLFIVIFWGVLLVFINPPFQNFDEPEHFYKIYAFSDGTMNFKKITSYTDGMFYFDTPKTFSAQVVPISIVQLVVQSKRMNPYFDENKIYNEGTKTSLKEILNSSQIKLDKHLKTIIIHPIPSYTIFSYILSVAVMFLLKLLNINPLFMMYIMRLCSLFLYTGLIYYAIKIMPVKKYLLLFIATMPVCLYLSGAINTDYMIIGLCFLFTAYCLKLAFSDNTQQISKKQILFLYTLALLICISKFVYLPIIFLFFIIPSEKFKSPKIKILNFLVLFLLSSITILSIISFNMHIFKDIFSYYNPQNAMQSISYTLKHPFAFISSLWKTICFYGTTYLKNSISDFGFSDVKIPSLIIYFYLLLLTLLGLEKENNHSQIDIKTKILFIVIFLVSLLITFLADYINFALEPNGYISGFKGRYLIPVYPLLFLILFNSKILFKKIKPIWLIWGYHTFFMVIFISSIICRYYNF